MLKGCQHWIFLDNRSLASGRVPVFKLWLCPVVLVLWRRTGDETGSGCNWRSRVLCACVGCMICGFWSVVSEKQLGILLNKTG